MLCFKLFKIFLEKHASHLLVNDHAFSGRMFVTPTHMSIILPISKSTMMTGDLQAIIELLFPQLSAVVNCKSAQNVSTRYPECCIV